MLRFEDLDPAVTSKEAEHRQLLELEQLGLDWDGVPVRQSERMDRYRDALTELRRQGVTYHCWCSRREVREAAQAPHHPTGHYPGTCRQLSKEQRAVREANGRPTALRLATDGQPLEITDRFSGAHQETVDDFVLERADGIPSYNLAVVVDDAAQGIEEVVRGDDLLAATPRQAYLHRLLGTAEPTWSHVPLVHGPGGQRLAKRDGAVTLEDRLALGDRPERVVAVLANSLGIITDQTEIRPVDLLSLVNPALITTDPWTLSPTLLTRPW